VPRRLAAAACLVGGVFVLLGLGWALLAAGVLLFVGLPAGTDESVAVVALRVRRAVATVVGRARVMPRRMVAGGAMSVAVLVIPAGLVLAAGVGAALVAFGGLMVGVSLLTGWNA
jgi:drug/metabolite transporter superfamily protein YnfA